MKETSLENVQISAEESDPGPGMGNSPKNKSFHYGNKNVKHDLKKKKNLFSVRKMRPWVFISQNPKAIPWFLRGFLLYRESQAHERRY